jgi:DNA polymerase-3 subunit gamma/tau
LESDVAVPRERRPLAESIVETPSRVPTPLEAASQAAESSIAVLARPEDSEAPVMAAEPGSSGIDIDVLRDAICVALETAGHNTAAVLLSSGNWIEADGAIRVEVRLKKTMLGLTMNAEAEKIVKAAAQAVGFSGKVAVVSGNGIAEGNGVEAPPAKRPAAAGSLQAEALAHPLVKQALELFNGEVRSVLDLREKRNA